MQLIALIQYCISVLVTNAYIFSISWTFNRIIDLCYFTLTSSYSDIRLLLFHNLVNQFFKLINSTALGGYDANIHNCDPKKPCVPTTKPKRLASAKISSDKNADEGPFKKQKPLVFLLDQFKRLLLFSSR